MNSPKGIKGKEADVSPSFRAEYYMLEREPEISTHSRRDFYKIWFINNTGILTLPDKSIAIDKPALVFLNPLVPYSFEPLKKTHSGYWCIFTEGFLRSYSNIENLKESSLFQIDADPVYYPDKKELSVINFIFEQLISTFNSIYIYKYQNIKNYLELLIHEGMKMQPRSSQIQRHNAAFRISRLFLNLLEKQFPIATPKRPLRLRKAGDFADELAVHVNHLNAVVQEVTGKSTSTHIAERILNEGKALLVSSDWSVADIAYSLGFEYPNHFNNFFKKHTGFTPLSLRK